MTERDPVHMPDPKGAGKLLGLIRSALAVWPDRAGPTAA